MVKSEGLHTVCQEAGCPNIFECWEDREATFLIGGERAPGAATSATSPPASRPTSTSTSRAGSPSRCADGAALLDHHRRRPRRPARRRRLALRRDDPPDPRPQPQHRRRDPRRPTSAPSPSWSARSSTPAPRCSRTTSRRCRGSSSGSARRSATSRSLDVLTMAREAGLVTKSNLILGMGEEDHEIEQALRDLHEAGCDILTITQYLRPSPRHHPIDRWVKPEEFVHWSEVAEELGFKGVMAGPLVRSSYRAGRLWATAMRQLGTPDPRAPRAPRGRRPTPPPARRRRPWWRAARPSAPRILSPMAARSTASDSPPRSPDGSPRSRGLPSPPRPSTRPSAGGWRWPPSASSSSLLSSASSSSAAGSTPSSSVSRWPSSPRRSC